MSVNITHSYECLVGVPYKTSSSHFIAHYVFVSLQTKRCHILSILFINLLFFFDNVFQFA